MVAMSTGLNRTTVGLKLGWILLTITRILSFESNHGGIETMTRIS